MENEPNIVRWFTVLENYVILHSKVSYFPSGFSPKFLSKWIRYPSKDSHFLDGAIPILLGNQAWLLDSPMGQFSVPSKWMIYRWPSAMSSFISFNMISPSSNGDFDFMGLSWEFHGDNADFMGISWEFHSSSPWNPQPSATSAPASFSATTRSGAPLQGRSRPVPSWPNSLTPQAKTVPRKTSWRSPAAGGGVGAPFHGSVTGGCL